MDNPKQQQGRAESIHDNTGMTSGSAARLRRHNAKDSMPASNLARRDFLAKFHKLADDARRLDSESSRYVVVDSNVMLITLLNKIGQLAASSFTLR
jgi:hypothetical protein